MRRQVRMLLQGNGGTLGSPCPCSCPSPCPCCSLTPYLKCRNSQFFLSLVSSAEVNEKSSILHTLWAGPPRAACSQRAARIDSAFYSLPLTSISPALTISAPHMTESECSAKAQIKALGNTTDEILRHLWNEVGILRAVSQIKLPHISLSPN